MKRLMLSVLFLCALCTLVRAQSHKKLKVLFLGNSYTDVNNLPQLIYNLAYANGDTLVFDFNYPGGYTLSDHYSNTTSRAKINSQNWDYVVLQAQSQEPAFAPWQVAIQTLPYAIALDTLIHNNDSCTQTVFYETWGRKNGDVNNCVVYPPVCTYIGMQDRLRSSYKLFADTCKAIMAPAGEAWRNSIATDPSLELYQSDESHPSLEGSYLTACVFYEVLFRKTVVANTYMNGLGTGTAYFLQTVAHAVVNDSLDVWNIGKYPSCATPTNIQHLSANLQLKLHPNPASSNLNLELPEEWRSQSLSYKVMDALGRVYLHGDLASKSISVSDLPAGLYFFEVRTEDKAYVTKFMKL